MDKSFYMQLFHKELDSIFIEIGKKEQQLNDQREQFEGNSGSFTNPGELPQEIKNPQLDIKDLGLGKFAKKVHQARIDILDYFNSQQNITATDIENKKVMLGQLRIELKSFF